MSSKIPTIAVTLEPGNQHSLLLNNIEDVLTDVEDLDNVNLPKTTCRKSKLKIKLAKKENDALTDVEDVEGSDPEDKSSSRDFSVSDLKLEDCSVEETTAVNNCKQNKESAKCYMRLPHANNPQDELTDIEDFVSDNELSSCGVPDTCYNVNQNHAEYTKITEAVDERKNKNQQTFNLDVDQITDAESVYSDNKSEHPKRKVKTRKKKARRSQCNMKKSFSQPLSGSPYGLDASKDFDSDVESENLFQKYKNKKCETKMNASQMNLTDTEDIPDNLSYRQRCGNKKRDVELRLPKESNAIYTDNEDLEGYEEEAATPFSVKLPPSVRTLILLHEDKSIIPTTKIVPLSEGKGSDFEYESEDTDCETFEGREILFENEHYNRGPTPEMRFYHENSVISEKPNVLKSNLNLRHVNPSSDAALTDAEDISLKSNLKVHYGGEDALTDVEDLDLTDPTSRKEKHFLGVKSRDSSPDVTDIENIALSDEEDVTSNTASPTCLVKQRISKVHSKSGKKGDVAGDETLYLKGGSFDECCVENIFEENIGRNSEVQEVNIQNGFLCFQNNREWDTTKKSSPKEGTPSSVAERDAEKQGEELGATSSATPHEASLRAAEGSTSGPQQTTSQERPVADQHQLSDEMKKLLQELERESKQ